METLILCLGILAGILQVIGYLAYYVPLYKGESKPNIAVWTLWSFGTLVGFISFKGMSEGWVKSILPMLCNLSCISILLVALYYGRYKPIDGYEKKVGVIYIVAALVAMFTPAYGNLVQQLGTFVSFLPQIRSVRNGKAVERPTPWFIWTAAYTTLLVVCLLDFERWEQLVYPINCLILHGTVGLIARRKEKYGHFNRT